MYSFFMCVARPLKKPMTATKKTNDSSNYQTNGWYYWANWALGPVPLWALPGLSLGSPWALPGLSLGSPWASLGPPWAPGPSDTGVSPWVLGSSLGLPGPPPWPWPSLGLPWAFPGPSLGLPWDGYREFPWAIY